MHNSARRIFQIVGSSALAVAITLSTCSFVLGDDPTNAARRLRYRPDGPLDLVEEVVKEHPENVEYWVELVRRLGAGSNDLLGDCASRESLRVHPNAPELLLVRASIRSRIEAFQLLDKLAAIPGHENEAADGKELLSLGLRVPASWDASDFLCSECAQWVSRLIAIERWNRAEEVLQQSLRDFPKDTGLAACRALILAHNGQYEEAVSAAPARDPSLEKPGYKIGKYRGLGDLLLLKGQPRLAIKVFANDERAATGAR